MFRCKVLRFVVPYAGLAYAAGMKDDEIVKGARQVAAFLTDPSGDVISLDAAVARHLAWFAAARDRGIRWRGIAALLIQAGARRPDGGALTGAQISAVYSRQNTKRVSAGNAPGKSAGGTKQTAVRQQPLAQPLPVSHTIKDTPPINSQLEAAGRAPDKSKIGHRSGDGSPASAPSGAEHNLDRIRERMQRAAAARRQRED